MAPMRARRSAPLPQRSARRLAFVAAAACAAATGVGSVSQSAFFFNKAGPAKPESPVQRQSRKQGAEQSFSSDIMGPLANLADAQTRNSEAGSQEATQMPMTKKEAWRFLAAFAPMVAAATTGGAVVDGSMLGVVDVMDVLDAQRVISQGQATVAALAQNNDMVQMQLALMDGSEKVLNLFRVPAAR
mmetsp:Transcript_14792/g.44446  ORF Transcript_14792/g.44446 Transcript_14792/m.44446 type:complete len:187 (+) Transcript_14792:94-654(+)